MPTPMKCPKCQEPLDHVGPTCAHCGAAVGSQRPRRSVSIWQIFVRIGIVMFALGGSVLAGGLGVYWCAEHVKFKADLQDPEKKAMLELASLLDPMGFDKMQQRLSMRAKVYPLLLLAMVFGLGGALLACLNLGRVAGLPVKTAGGLLMIGGALRPPRSRPSRWCSLAC